MSVFGLLCVLSCVRVSRTLARRPRSERMRGSGSAKRSAVTSCAWACFAQLGRWLGFVVASAGVLLACLAGLAGFSLRCVRASCYPAVPGAGRDVDGA